MKTIGIVCTNFNRAIGKDNQLLFQLRKDMNLFKNITKTTQDKSKLNAVLMGSNTFYSIPENFRPLANRANLVVSKNNFGDISNRLAVCNHSNVFTNIQSSLKYVYESKNFENLYVIGGSSIYEYFIYVFI